MFIGFFWIIYLFNKNIVFYNFFAIQKIIRRKHKILKNSNTLNKLLKKYWTLLV